MKKEFLLLLALCATLSFELKAQGEFAPIGAEWYYSWATNSIPEDPGREVGYIKLKSLKDTLLDGQACRKLQRTWIHKDYHNPDAPIDTGKSYLYLYSDTNAVFYYDGVLALFIPLYMFNVNVGDTAIYRVPSRFDFLPDTLFSMLITDITTSTIGGVPLKTIHHGSLDGMMGFGSSLNDPYTEKLGSLTAFLLCHQPLGHVMNYTPTLRCYVDSEITYRAEPDIPCDYLEGTNKIEGIHQYARTPIAIYPNPARGYVTIHNEDAGHPITSVEVYGVVGRKIKTFAFENSDQEQVLPITDLLPGNYILKIKSKARSINRKLMVH